MIRVYGLGSVVLLFSLDCCAPLNQSLGALGISHMNEALLFVPRALLVSPSANLGPHLGECGPRLHTHTHSPTLSSSQSLVPGTTWALPQSPPCLAADLLSSFLLIGVLFIISLSLLFGVVKVRPAQGWRGQEHTPSCCPEHPMALHVFIWRRCWSPMGLHNLPGYQGSFGVVGCILWTVSGAGSVEIKEKGWGKYGIQGKGL